MTEHRFYSPLKLGLLTVTIAYLLFNLHTMFTLEWIGEWDRIAGVLSLFVSVGFMGAISLPYFCYVTAGILESTILPIVLLVLAYKLSPLKPIKGAIKWSLISGTVIIFVYWLLNTCIWAFVIPVKGPEYVTSYPYMMAAFLSTLIGLLALTL